MDTTKYTKRAGTSGIQGQLYETKLISLIYFRLTHDDSVQQFSLATNRDDIGAFDDICIKAKIKGFKKPVAVFIQAKHRENDKLLTFTSKTDLAKYFNSYLDIRRAFEPHSKDVIFGGKFDETECLFVMYTTAKDDPNNKIYEGSLADYLNELLGTGGSCKQPSYTEEGLDFLCKIVMQEQITALAEQLAKFICDGSDSVMSMNNDLILRYHVILAHKVLDVSEIKHEGHRIASFRPDFFATNEEFLVLFKNILCLEVLLLKRKSEETDVQSLLLEFLSEPSEVPTLSKLIGRVLTYKKGKLGLLSKSMTDDLKRQLDKANVSQSTVYEAAELAAKEHLLCPELKLKVPAFFGNNDLTIRGNDEKIEKRLDHLTTKLKEILEKSNPNDIVTIDEREGDGFLQLNGGIASAVGNILVFDESSKLLKFTDNFESLSNLAKKWYEKLKSNIKNLHEYKLDVKVKKFPKLSFERGEYDVSLVRDFYEKLIFYTNQADQYGVEKILRGEIEDYPCSDVNNFRVRSDVIFLKYHDEIQKLWMKPKVGSYLTKKSKIYEKAVTNAMSEPLMGVLTIMYKIKCKDYKFNENALKRFKLHGQIIGTIIATESCELTVAKVEQFLGNKDHVVLDLEDIFNLPLKNHNHLCKELKDTSKEMTLIIVCHNFQDPKNDKSKRLENIAKFVEGKQIIIITNKTSVGIMTQYFSQPSKILKDERSVFTDLSVESQKKFLATSKIKLQGENVSLDILGVDESVELIDEDVFNKVINNETIEIGDMAIYNNYEKQFYIDRRVSRTKNQERNKFDDVKDKVLETFYDLEDDTVLITAESGMGKSTLLTHLSLKTKEFEPNVWIVKINLPEHGKKLEDHSAWEGDDAFNTLLSLTFMCQTAVISSPSDQLLVELEESPNGKVSLKQCSGDKSTVFELKMFLHFYNKRKLIFLFDGFQIVMPFKNEVLLLLNSVRSYPLKQKVWITSRPFYPYKSDLEEEFGPSYELENFSRFEQDTLLNSIWKSKIQLNNLYIKETIDHFVDYVVDGFLKDTHIHEYLRGYVLLLDYFKMESAAAGIDFPYEKHYNNFMTSFGLCSSTISCFPDDITPRGLSEVAEDEEFLVVFKNILCLEVLLIKPKSEETDVLSLLLEFLNEPSEVTTLSKLIGRVLTYKKGKLGLLSKSMTDDLKRQLDKANVSQSTVYEAAELAAKEHLLCPELKLKVPAFFGNNDLTIRGNDEKIEKRLDHLTTKLKEILEKSNPNDIVTIDEREGDGFLQLNGGIASAVGNILVFDESSKLLKFTDNFESLSNLAKT